MSTVTRFDYVYEVFERQCEIALANLAKIYDAVGDRVSAVFITGTDFGTQNGPFISPTSLPQALPAVPPPRERLDPPAHAVEDVHPLLRLDRRPAARLRRRRLRHPQSGAVFGGGHGPADAEGEVRRHGSPSGAAASTRRRRCPSARRTKCAGRSASGSRSSAAAAGSSSTRSTTSRPARPSRTSWPCSTRCANTELTNSRRCRLSLRESTRLSRSERRQFTANPS